MNQSFLERVRQFYRDNPDEYLTAHDLVVKFGVTKHTVQTHLKTLVSEGVLVYAPGYIAGPAVRRMAA